MTNLVGGQDEAGALARLGFEELGGFAQSIGTMERGIAARAFRYVPAGRPIRAIHDTVSRGVSGGLGGAASAAGRGAQTLVERRPRAERPLSATPRGGLGIAVLNGLVGDRLEREGSPLHQPMAIRVDDLPVAPERRALAQAFPAATPRARRLPPRADGDGARLAPRRSASPTARASHRDARRHAGLRPLQQRPPHLRERPLAGRPARARGRRVAGRGRGGRARRALDGRAGRPQRLPPRRAGGGGVGRQGAARDLARLAAHGRAARAGRPLRRATGSAGCRRRACSAPSCAAAAPASATSAPGLAGRRGLARSRPRGAARRRLRRRSRCSRAPRTASCPRRSPAARATRWAACSATRSCWCPARRAARARATLGFEAEYGLHIGATHHIALLNHPAVYEKLHAWLR